MVADLEEADLHRRLPQLFGNVIFSFGKVRQVDTAHFAGEGLFALGAHQRLFFQFL